jgi:hypothetical protein
LSEGTVWTFNGAVDAAVTGAPRNFEVHEKLTSANPGVAWMSALVVVCPVTCKVIPTGIETEPEVLKDLPRIQAAVRCPACGEQHFWTCDDARLGRTDGGTASRRSGGRQVVWRVPLGPWSRLSSEQRQELMAL